MLNGVVLNLSERVVFNNSKHLPSSMRLLIVGPSNCGKTNLLFRALLESNILDYNNLIIFSPTISQQEYQLLYHGFSNGLSKELIVSIALNQNDFKNIPIPMICKKIAEVATNLDPAKSISITMSDKINEIPLPEKLDKSRKNLIVLDDCVSIENQHLISQYFCSGRHHTVNCIYLSQSYFDLPRTIRLNANHIILFKVSTRNLNDIYNSAVGKIMDKKLFMTLAQNVFSKKYNYISINRETDKISTDLFEDAESSSSEDE